MFKVLLADDENWVVESLKASINWQEYGFEIIGVAYNGPEALHLIENLKPDLVFTDIRMPGLSGLELIKKSAEMGLNVYFIVASGYAEFAYAQKAMNCGALGYCLKPFDEMEIINCLNKARKVLECRTPSAEPEFTDFMKAKNKACEVVNADSSEINRLLKQLEDAIRIKNLPEIYGSFDALEKLFECGKYSIKHAYYTYNIVMSLTYRYINESQETFIDNYEQLPFLFENISGMLQYLRDTILNQADMKSDDISCGIENKTMKGIIKFVDSNFNQGISIQSISRKFFLNPNYVSQLFKKEIGLNYTEYLTKIRFDFACKLLKESDLSIQQISEKSGYNDYFYFTRVFKRLAGMTPSEFRSKESSDIEF